MYGMQERVMIRQLIVPVLAMGVLAGCSLAPPYQQPRTDPPPPAYTGDWHPAHPAELEPRGAWWQLFADPELNSLEQQLPATNQNLAAAFARLEQARAEVRFVRSGYFPTVSAAAGASRERTSVNSPQYSQSKPSTQNNLVLESDVSYELDVFGRVRNSVAAARADAQANAADVDALELSLQAELAMDYFTLRNQDTRQALLDETVSAYERALQLNQNLYDGGAAPLTDVAQARAQLETARTQAEDIHLQRAQTEHAIAVLTGQSPSSFHIQPAALSPEVGPPAIAAGLPSTLLERRPDVAAAERRVAAANASIGVARAAYFPNFSLTAALGLESTSGASLFQGPSRLWALGPTALVTLFDGGKRRAQTDAARAAYDEQAADYRQTVLTAFQEVEDSLAGLGHLQHEATSESAAVEAAAMELDQARDRYSAGITTYLEVVIAENALLSSQLAAADIQARRLNAGVLLAKALGGGWDRQQLTSGR
jgi:NodT family efflux transporter outer membrane factor (OMF) lipoprotein